MGLSKRKHGEAQVEVYKTDEFLIHVYKYVEESESINKQCPRHVQNPIAMQTTLVAYVDQSQPREAQPREAQPREAQPREDEFLYEAAIFF